MDLRSDTKWYKDGTLELKALQQQVTRFSALVLGNVATMQVSDFKNWSTDRFKAGMFN